MFPAGAFIVTLLVYVDYQEANDHIVDDMVYGTSLVIGSLSLLVLPPTVHKMSQLTFKVEPPALAGHVCQDFAKLFYNVSLVQYKRKHAMNNHFKMFSNNG